MTGDNNKLDTYDTHVNKGNIMDKEQGITFISVHLNTLVGSVTGTLICIGLATLLIYICSGPMRKCWKRMRGSTRSSERRSTRSSETTTRTGGGGSASTGTEMQCLDRRFSEVPYPMYPYVTPMNPRIWTSWATEHFRGGGCGTCTTFRECDCNKGNDSSYVIQIKNNWIMMVDYGYDNGKRAEYRSGAFICQGLTGFG